MVLQSGGWLTLEEAKDLIETGVAVDKSEIMEKDDLSSSNVPADESKTIGTVVDDLGRIMVKQGFERGDKTKYPTPVYFGTNANSKKPNFNANLAISYPNKEHAIVYFGCIPKKLGKGPELEQFKVQIDNESKTLYDALQELGKKYKEPMQVQADWNNALFIFFYQSKRPTNEKEIEALVSEAQSGSKETRDKIQEMLKASNPDYSGVVSFAGGEAVYKRYQRLLEKANQ